MEHRQGEIRFGWFDPDINSLIKQEQANDRPLNGHYNQNEEFFLKLDNTFTVPQFPIHHDVDTPRPPEGYRKSLIGFIRQILPYCSNLFQGLSYIFDPTSIFRPLFFQIYKVKEEHYLFVLRLDLSFRPSDSELITSGSNDTSHSFETKKLFIEADLIPVSRFLYEQEKMVGCMIQQDVSKTWIGESGRGYVIQGIWIDSDLTKFFSKLLLPEGKRSYPYFPFTCKHQAICHTVINLSPEGRKSHLKMIFQAIPFLRRHIETIQETLRHNDFSPNLDSFKTLKQQVPEKWYSRWDSLKVEPYLNERDMKEFKVDFS
jgi:hypothetical protein